MPGPKGRLQHGERKVVDGFGNRRILKDHQKWKGKNGEKIIGSFRTHFRLKTKDQRLKTKTVIPFSHYICGLWSSVFGLWSKSLKKSILAAVAIVAVDREPLQKMKIA